MNYKIISLLIQYGNLSKAEIIDFNKDSSLNQIEESLIFLLKKGYLFNKENNYEISQRYKNNIGIYFSKSEKFGFVDINDDLSYFVPGKLSSGAITGDIVYFYTKIDKMGDGKQKIAIIKRTLFHKKSEVIGQILMINDKLKFINKDQTTFNYEIENKEFKLIENNWYTSSVISRTDNNFKIRINDDLGDESKVDLYIKLGLIKYNIKPEFRFNTIKEAKSFKVEWEKEKNKRRDLTKMLTITIDGKEAKDLDDAFSLEKVNSNYKLLVHIADVSHFVKEGLSIDKDAYAKGTSTYLVDRVVPMLPFELSNDLCSLNPNGKKLAMTVEMTIDQNGNLLESNIYESIIHSNARLNYDEVNDLLKNKINNVVNEDITNLLKLANGLSKILKNKYVSDGYIEFNSPEVKVLLDKNRFPYKLQLRKQDESEIMIEHFMILANVSAATFFVKNKFPGIYRIHDKPKQEKVSMAKNVLKSFGYNKSLNQNEWSNSEYQKATKWLSKKPYEEIVNKFLIQSMEKAKYDNKNIGHFGLGLKQYTHFTSPIRRYPDLVAHRYIKEIINGNKSNFSKPLIEKKINAYAIHSSKKEKDAIYCERYVNDALKSLYMEKHIGEKFIAYITNINSKGIFVELENTVNGFIEFYRNKIENPVINENSNSIKLPNYSEPKKLGDAIEVMVESCSPIDGRVNFSI